jgi:hypothetical protein
VKRYTSTLGPVLRARQAQEGMARSALQKANHAAAAAERASAATFAHYREVAAAPNPSFLAAREQGELAALAVKGSRDAVSAKKADARNALEDYVDAAKAVSAAERLEERRREEHALAALREETALVDEVVTARYARARRAVKKGDPSR